MRTMLPDGRIEGAQPVNRTAVRATPVQPTQRLDERPGDVTTIWRDGDVVRQSPGQRARVFPSIAPLEGPQ
jgi:hypothetical protein